MDLQPGPGMPPPTGQALDFPAPVTLASDPRARTVVAATVGVPDRGIAGGLPPRAVGVGLALFGLFLLSYGLGGLGGSGLLAALLSLLLGALAVAAGGWALVTGTAPGESATGLSPEGDARRRRLARWVLTAALAVVVVLTAVLVITSRA